jgi:hypothetical protein
MAKGKNFDKVEVTLLLDLAEKILPIGINEWNDVEVQFNSNRGRRGVYRDASSLRRKYSALRKSKKPTGGLHCSMHHVPNLTPTSRLPGVPDCPSEVLRAIKIHEQIDRKITVQISPDAPDSPATAGSAELLEAWFPGTMRRTSSDQASSLSLRVNPSDEVPDADSNIPEHGEILEETQQTEKLADKHLEPQAEEGAFNASEGILTDCFSGLT